MVSSRPCRFTTAARLPWAQLGPGNALTGSTELAMKRKALRNPRTRKGAALLACDARSGAGRGGEIYRLITQGHDRKAHIAPGARLKRGPRWRPSSALAGCGVRRVFRGALRSSTSWNFDLNIGAVVCRPSPDESRSVFKNTQESLNRKAIEVVTKIGKPSVFVALR